MVNFDRKYLVNDVLKAKCGANIRVELIDRHTGQLVDDEIPDLKLEVRTCHMHCAHEHGMHSMRAHCTCMVKRTQGHCGALSVNTCIAHM